jgi:hypothetical protein
MKRAPPPSVGKGAVTARTAAAQLRWWSGLKGPSAGTPLYSACPLLFVLTRSVLLLDGRDRAPGRAHVWGAAAGLVTSGGEVARLNGSLLDQVRSVIEVHMPARTSVSRNWPASWPTAAGTCTDGRRSPPPRVPRTCCAAWGWSGPRSCSTPVRAPSRRSPAAQASRASPTSRTASRTISACGRPGTASSRRGYSRASTVGGALKSTCDDRANIRDMAANAS